MDEYTQQLIEQSIAEMNDEEFDALIKRTRPPQLTPIEAAQAKAAAAIRTHLS